MSDPERPVDTTTGANPGGVREEESPAPGGAVPDELGAMRGEPQSDDLGDGADLTADATGEAGPAEADEPGTRE